MLRKLIALAITTGLAKKVYDHYTGAAAKPAAADKPARKSAAKPTAVRRTRAKRDTA